MSLLQVKLWNIQSRVIKIIRSLLVSTKISNHEELARFLNDSATTHSPLAECCRAWFQQKMVSLCIDPFSSQAGQVKTESAVLANINCYFWTTHTHLVDLQEYTNQVTNSIANGVTYALLQWYSWLLPTINTVLTKKNWWTFTEEKHWRCMKHRVAAQLYNSPSGYYRCCKWSATPVSLVMASSGALTKFTHAWTAVALHCYVYTGMLFVFKGFTFQHCSYLFCVPSTAIIEWYSVVCLCFVFSFRLCWILA